MLFVVEGGKHTTSLSTVTMGTYRVIVDPATVVAVAMLAVAALSSLFNAFYAFNITPKPLNSAIEASEWCFFSHPFTF
jgi:hypothetical protein